MNKILIGILLVCVGVSLASFPPEWGYDYYALSLRVGSAMKDSTKADGWAYIDSLQVNWANFATASFTSIEADTATINDVISAGSAYMDLDSLDAVDVVGTNATFTALNTDSAYADYFSTAGATGYLSMSGDTLFFTRTGLAGDHDQVLCFVDESGNKQCFAWDDGLGSFSLSAPLRGPAGGFMADRGSNLWSRITTQLTYGLWDSSALLTRLVVDPNFSGSGTLQLGETGDNDLTNINSQLYYTPKTIAADDATPSVAGGNVFTTSANTGATAITDLDDPIAGQIVYLIGGSNTNSSTIADSGNFNLSAAWTANEDDVLVLYVVADDNYIELSRTDN
jgi:hypothetical protein